MSEVRDFRGQRRQVEVCVGGASLNVGVVTIYMGNRSFIK